jgi:hypothetical protein
VGSVPGVWIGSNLTLKVPAGVLRTTLGLVLIGAGLGLLSKAGAGIPGVVIAAFPVAVAVMVVAVLVRGSRNGSDGTPESVQGAFQPPPRDGAEQVRVAVPSNDLPPTRGPVGG